MLRAREYMDARRDWPSCGRIIGRALRGLAARMLCSPFRAGSAHIVLLRPIRIGKRCDDGPEQRIDLRELPPQSPHGNGRCEGAEIGEDEAKHFQLLSGMGLRR